MAKKIDPAKAKAQRQKKIAIVGGVLLLGLLAFQVPRTMKMLHNPGNVTTSASTTLAATTPASTPLAPPSLDGATASLSSGSGSGSGSGGSSVSAATSDDGVVDPSTPLPASSGQLISFNRFKSKDPFAQQIVDCGSDACGASDGAGAGSGVGGSTSGGGTSSSGSGSSAAPAPAARPAKKLTTAAISVNGAVSTVAVGRPFPARDPVFVLVALKPGEARIGISGGSLEGGATAIGLRLGKTLTLQNTADGARYVLKLLRTA